MFAALLFLFSLMTAPVAHANEVDTLVPASPMALQLDLRSQRPALPSEFLLQADPSNGSVEMATDLYRRSRTLFGIGRVVTIAGTASMVLSFPVAVAMTAGWGALFAFLGMAYIGTAVGCIGLAIEAFGWGGAARALGMRKGGMVNKGPGQGSIVMAVLSLIFPPALIVGLILAEEQNKITHRSWTQLAKLPPMRVNLERTHRGPALVARF